MRADMDALQSEVSSSAAWLDAPTEHQPQANQAPMETENSVDE